MTFVVIQLACSQPVLVVTSLVLADIRRGVNENADQAPASVATMSWRLDRPEPDGRAGRGSRQSALESSHDVLRTVRQRLAAVPGVRSIAISTDGHPRPDRRKMQMVSFNRVKAFDVARGSEPAATARVAQVYVDNDYFATLGMPLVRGRTIGVDDDRRGSRAVVVNEAAAELLWPGQDPIGKRVVRHDGDGDNVAQVTSLEVIGLVGAPSYDTQQTEPKVFAPLSTAASAWESNLVVRTSGDARAYVPSIRGAIHEVDPYVAIDDVITLAERYAGQRREAVQSNAAAFAVGAAALLLASLGLYAIIAFAVAQRTREIGIRLAIGATSGSVVRHFFRNGLIVSAIGLAIGLPLTVAGIRVVQANVLGFTLQNVAAVSLVVPVLLAVAALASWLPARRAGRVDPVIALRSE
jgi:hypothetical protein